jgi:uncharacterized protein GlcG (DUF336 family)
VAPRKIDHAHHRTHQTNCGPRHRGGSSNSLRLSIVIVDGGANLVYAERMDDAMIGSVETALRKTRSAVLFKRPTKAFEDMLAGGRMAILSLPDAMPIEGGVPLLADGRIEGAIGVSGGTAQQDGIAAQAAADWFLQKTS